MTLFHLLSHTISVVDWSPCYQQVSTTSCTGLHPLTIRVGLLFQAGVMQGAMFLLMAQMSTCKTKAHQSFIFESHHKFVPFWVNDQASSPERWVKGVLIRMCRNRAWSDLNGLLSTIITVPSSDPISLAVSLVIRSKGKPQTWIHSGTCVKTILCVIIPISHLHITKRWLSKLQGTCTHYSWLSSLNQNKYSPLPTSTIRRLLPSFHAERNRLPYGWCLSS